MNKNLLLWLGIIALLAAGYFMLRSQAALPERNEDQGPAAAPQERPLPALSWRFETIETAGDDLAPRTKVALIADGDVYDMGAYAGSCSEVARENLLPGEVAAVLCWWAGAGDEIGVFKEGGSYAVKRGVQEEPTAESEGFRGNFVTLTEL